MNLLNNPDYNVLSETLVDGTREVEATYAPQPTACTACGAVGQFRRHGTQKQKVRDLPTLARPTLILLARQRYRCRACGATFSQPVQGLNEAGTMTERLVRYIQEEAVVRPYTHVAAATGVTEGTVRNLFAEYIQRLDERVRFVTPEVLGIDEIHLLNNYRCVLTNVRERTLLDVLPSRLQPVVFQRLMRLEERRKVDIVTMDMYHVYRECARQALPQAQVVVDKFHVVRMANDAMEALRKGIRAKLPPKERVGLMHDRHAFLRRRSNLKERDLLKMDAWAAAYPDLMRIYEDKEAYFEIWDSKSESEARERYAEWLAKLPDDQKPAWKPLLTAMRNWESEIFAYFRIGETNAYTEAMNRLIKDVHRIGRGYSFEAIRAKMLYARGEYRKPGEASYLRTEERLRALRATPVEILADGSYGKRISTVLEQLADDGESTPVYE